MNAADTFGFTSSLSGTTATIAIASGNDKVTIAEQHGTSGTNSNKGSMYDGSGTSYTVANYCYRSASGLTEKGDYYFGYTLTIADGYALDLSQIDWAMYVSSGFKYQVVLSNSAGTIYDSNSKTIGNYNKNTATNMTGTSALSATALTGTVDLKVYYWFDNASKYIAPKSLTLTGTVNSVSPTALPVFSTNLPTTATIGVGSSETLSVASSNATSYQWYKASGTSVNAEADQPITGATEASYSYTATAAGTEYLYCMATNDNGSTTSNVCAVTAVSLLTVSYPTANIEDSGKGTGTPDGLVSTASVGLSGDNVSWNGTFSYDNVTYAAVKTANTTTTDDKMTFTIYPKKGITFTPTKVSFGAIRTGTDGGTMNVKVNSTTLTSTAVPGRNSSGKEKDGYSFSYNISNITATKTSPLTVTIAMVGMSGTRGWGVADLVVEGTYTGTAEDGEMYSVATSVNIDGAGTVTQSPAGSSLEEETSVTFTAAANTGYAFVNWTDDNNQNAELSTNAKYTISSLSANTAITANFKALMAVNFDKGNSGAYGEVPATHYGDGTVTFTIPANQTLFKDGYTLIGWEANGLAYGFLEYSFNDNTTLTPQFTQNNVTTENFPEETTITWNFGKSNGAPAYSGIESANVKQVAIGDNTIDLGIKMAGGSNAGRNDEWLNTQGKDFTVPVTTGAVIKAKVYYASGSATFGDEVIAYDESTHGSTGNVVYTYTYTGEDDVLTVNVGNQLLSYISVTYPFVEQRQPSDLSLNLPAETVTLTANEPTLQLNPTTSATVALTYKSSNEMIATVDANGLITAVANGTAVITVSQKDDEVYQDDSKSVTVTVNNGVIPSYSVEMILNNETGSMITSDEQVQGTQVSFGINAANERVEADADDAVVTVSGKYWNEHGFSGVTLTVKATGNMKFTIGNCTFNNETATITNANNETVASASLSGTGCWKGSHSDVTVMYYEGEATTLTFNNPSYCPYIKVESVGEIEKYTVTFMNGNTEVDQKQVITGEGVGTLPTLQVGDNEMLLGWYADTNDMGSKVSASTVPAGDVTYYAVVVSQPTAVAGYIVPESAAELVGAIQYANENSSANNPVKIFLKNGTYDLGSIAETFQITSSYVSLIGESLDGTIITNVPTQEGLGTATLLYNKGQYNYLQDLTLWNNYPYGNSTGRAASLKDEGNYTICNNVWLYSHQDTYYSHRNHSTFYFKGGKISGCVDYMCGQSRVYYDGVTLSNDNRGTTMTANSELYVFNNCVIENGGQTYNFGRAWSATDDFGDPVCIFLNTTLMDNGSKLASTRWNANCMNTDYAIAGEYGTMNASGTDITPESNTVTFSKKSTTLNTILTADEAATYTMEYTLGDWAATAASDVEQATVNAVTMDGNTLSWESDAEAFLIEKDGAFVALTEEKTYDVSNFGTGLYTVRAANARGGFGEATQVAGAGTLTWNIATGTSATALTSIQVSTIDGIAATDMTAITADAADAAGKTNLSVKLNCGTAETAAATVTFTVPDGYAFIPYSTTAKVQPISKDAYVKVALGDVASEATSFTAGTITDAVLTEDGTRQLTGTVTLGIYCYDGAESGVTTYRLGTPITVTGQLVELPAQSVTVTISNAGWATLYTDKALDFSQVEGLTAYTATVSDNTVTLTEATEIGSDAGVVLQGEAGEYEIPVLGVEPNTAKGDLTGNATEATAYNEFANFQKTIYILAPVNNGKDVQFVPCTSGSIAAKKAFLVLDTPASGAKAMQVVFASETTGIDNVNVSVPVPVKRIQNGQLVIEKNGKTYNAAGQQK